MAVTVNVPLSNILQSVERPVVFDIIRQVQDLTQISSKTHIRFYGEDAKAAQYNSTITQDKEQDNLWPHTENLTIEVDEDHDPDRFMATKIAGGENRPFFYDEPLSIVMKPAYSTSLVKISFQYKASDKNQATKWRNDIRARFSMGRQQNVHDISYSYEIPPAYMELLEHIHSLRENVAGYEESFEEWFTRCSSNRIHRLTNSNGKKTLWTVTETQGDILGAFDFEGVPDKSTRDDEPNLWVSSFTYVFRYDKPIEGVMVYPVCVHQQEIAAKYRPRDNVLPVKKKAAGTSLESIRQFQTSERDAAYRGNLGLMVPEYDNFVPKSYPMGTIRAASVLVSIDPDHPKDFFHLDQMGDFDLRSAVLDFIKYSEYPYMCNQYASILQVHHFVDLQIKDQNNLYVDSDFGIRSKTDLDLRREHRIRLGLVANLNYLPLAALQRLKDNPVAAIVLLTSINSAITHIGNQGDIGYNRIPLNMLQGLGLRYEPDGWTIVTDNETVMNNLRGHYGHRWSLVQNLFIETHGA
jgi:hypothetical protein